jgi:putative glutamine amidotransferase
MDTRKPLIGIPACVKEIGQHSFHAVAEQYVNAAAAGANAIPALLPAMGAEWDFDALFSRFDGFLFTGSPSNVEPHHYDGEPSRPGTLHDPRRDATTLPLIRAALAAGMPLLALCRGHQELNVALGGSLHQHVHELPGKQEHRAERGLPNDIRYAPAHAIRLTPGGYLAGLAGTTEVMVNSLHGQAIDRLGQGLVVEAVAADGVIEAVRVENARAFALGIQWHPEWSIATNAFSRAIFAAFGDACRARAVARHKPSQRDSKRVA